MADRKSAAARKAEIENLLRTIRREYSPYWRTRVPEAYDRFTRTPIHFSGEPDPNPGGATIQDPLLRTNSAIKMPANAQTFRGLDAFENYLQHNSRPMKHELMHVLQNIDRHPFIAADDKVRSGLDAKNFYRMRPDYGNDDEISAYLLSRTGDLNNHIRKTWEMDNPIFQKPRTWNPFDSPTQPRATDIEDLRQKYMNALPLGLQGLINNIMGNR